MKTVSSLGVGGAIKARKGFTLIELMIVVVIISILSALAIPSYQRYVLRTHRKDAMSALQGLAQAMERYYVQHNNTYIGADTGGVPNFFASTSPTDGGTARYNLRITGATASAYTLQAQPVGAQANDGLIQLDNTGRRAWDKDNSGAFSASEFSWND